MNGGVGSLVGSVADFGLQALGNAVLPMSKAQQQMNEYNALEAQKARDFSAQQAEIERDWQEEQNVKYNSLQGRIQQANEAGVNPMLIATGSAVSPASITGTHPAAPAASGSSTSPIGQISDMTSAALGFSKLGAEIKNIQASTRLMAADALNKEIDSITRGEINEMTIKQGAQTIKESEAEIKVKAARVQDLTASALERSQSVAESLERVRLISAQVGTEYLEQAAIGQSIIESKENVKVKSAQYGLLLLEQSSERERTKLIKAQREQTKSQTKLNRSQIDEINRQIRLLEQEYDFNEIMNGFSEIVASQGASVAYQWDDSNYDDKPLIQSLIRVINGLERLVDFNSSTSRVDYSKQ